MMEAQLGLIKRELNDMFAFLSLVQGKLFTCYMVLMRLPNYTENFSRAEHRCTFDVFIAVLCAWYTVLFTGSLTRLPTLLINYQGFINSLKNSSILWLFFSDCYLLLWFELCSLKRYVEDLSPIAKNVTIWGQDLYQVILRSLGWALIQNDMCYYYKEGIWTQRHA